MNKPTPFFILAMTIIILGMITMMLLYYVAKNVMEMREAELLQSNNHYQQRELDCDEYDDLWSCIIYDKGD